MKKFLRSAAAVGFLAASLTTPLQAAAGSELEKQVQELVKQNKMLLERVMQLEKMIGGQAGHDHYKGLAEKTDVRSVSSINERLQQVEIVLADKKHAEVGADEESLLSKIKDYVEFTTLVEVEASSSDNFADDEESDISLATVEIGIDAHISDWSHAHILLLYEEEPGEDDHLLVDEGTITLGNSDVFPAFITVGKMYMPFGSYLTNMISDTLTLEIGEINDTAVQAGFESGGYYGSLYAFNGHLKEINDDDTIDNYGANIGFANDHGDLSYDFGMGWLNNIGDSDGMGDTISGNVVDDEIADYVDGFAVHFLLGYGSFSFFAEYVGALDEFEPGELAFNGNGAEPEAWGVELGYTTELFSKEVTFAVAYQETGEALALELPEERYLVGAGMAIFRKTSLLLEYLHDEDYGSGDGGTGDDADTVTMQLAVEF